MTEAFLCTEPGMRHTYYYGQLLQYSPRMIKTRISSIAQEMDDIATIHQETSVQTKTVRLDSIPRRAMHMYVKREREIWAEQMSNR